MLWLRVCDTSHRLRKHGRRRQIPSFFTIFFFCVFQCKTIFTQIRMTDCVVSHRFCFLHIGRNLYLIHLHESDCESTSINSSRSNDNQYYDKWFVDLWTVHYFACRQLIIAQRQRIFEIFESGFMPEHQPMVNWNWVENSALTGNKKSGQKFDTCDPRTIYRPFNSDWLLSRNEFLIWFISNLTLCFLSASIFF